MTIHPIKTPISATISPPPDKSISHRALILGAIAYGTTKIHNLLLSDDIYSTISCLRQLGIKIDIGELTLVHGKGLYGLSAPKIPLDCGNSGTTMRLLAGILAAQPFVSILTGDESLLSRPMQRIIEPLSLMGAKIESTDGKAPLTIHGIALRPIIYHMPIQSAQVKSALQLADLYTPLKSNFSGAELTRNHTDIMLMQMSKGRKLYATDITIPGDISSAAFFMVLALLHAEEGMVIENVGLNPTRIAIIAALKAMNGNIVMTTKSHKNGESMGSISIKKSELVPLKIAPETAPLLIDEIPILAVAAAFAGGVSTFTGLMELRTKETDRIHAISTELAKLGIDIKPTFDGMVINGGFRGQSPRAGDSPLLDSHGDHRIAMALAIAATKAPGSVTIQNSDCISISYPNFFGSLASVCSPCHPVLDTGSSILS